MTLVDALNAATLGAGGVTAAAGQVAVSAEVMRRALNSLGVRLDIRSEAFRASQAELAVGVMNAIDPRRTIFRAQPAELAIGRQPEFQFKALFVRRDTGGV